MQKFLPTYIKWLIILVIPILYFLVEIEPNLILDILWLYVFALVTKDFILKVVLKKKYCNISDR